MVSKLAKLLLAFDISQILRKNGAQRMPIKVNTLSITRPHAPIVHQFSIHRHMTPAAVEWKWPVSGMGKARMPSVYMSERKRYAEREDRKRKARVEGRLRMWPWSSAPARRTVKMLNVKVRS